MPSLFWFETRSLFLNAERRGRLKAGEAALSMAQLRGLPLQDEGAGADPSFWRSPHGARFSAYDASYLALAVSWRCLWRPPTRARRRRRGGRRRNARAAGGPVHERARPVLGRRSRRPAARCSSTRSPPSCRWTGATASPRSSPTTTSRRSSTWRARAWAKTRCARSPRIWPISRPGRRRRRGAPLPWPTPEALALKFVAHHLWDPAKRESDPAHGMPAEVTAALVAAGLLRVDGPHAPATVRRRLASWSTLHRWRGIAGPFASPALRAAVRLAVRAAARPRRRKSKRAVTRRILDRLLATCGGETLADCRDRALLLVAFGSGGRRRSEIAAPARRAAQRRSAGRPRSRRPRLAAPALHGDRARPHQNRRRR